MMRLHRSPGDVCQAARSEGGEGLLNLAVPKEFGGSGALTGNAHLTAYLVTEEISRACSATGWDLIIHYHQCGAVARLGNEEQKRRILGDVVQGAIMGSPPSVAR